jgi:hypothetical protein
VTVTNSNVIYVNILVICKLLQVVLDYDCLKARFMSCLSELMSREPQWR